MKYLIIVLAILASSCNRTKENTLVVILENGENMIAQISEYSSLPSPTLKSAKFVKGRCEFDLSDIKLSHFKLSIHPDTEEGVMEQQSYLLFKDKEGIRMKIDKANNGVEILSSDINIECNQLLSEFDFTKKIRNILADNLSKEVMHEKFVQIKADYQNFIISRIKPECKSRVLCYFFDDVIKRTGLDDKRLIKDVFLRFDNSLSTSQEYTQIKDLVNSNDLTTVGNSFPSLKLKDTNKSIVDFSPEKGKYVFIDFWASWCGPCCKEIPHLKELYKLYNNKGLEFVSISFDEKDKDWSSALIKFNMPWTNYSAFYNKTNKIATLFNVKYIPYNFLLNDKGEIVAVNIHGEELDEMLEKIFN